MTPTRPENRRGHAVVLGASMAGLLAARVLAESHDAVTVIERDDLSAPGDRRGVPQGRHVHALLARGTRIIEDLFPGITDELLDAGAVSCRSLTQMRMTVAGHTLRRGDSGYSLLQASRPMLEWHVRQRVRALDRVTVLDRHEVGGLLTRGDRVEGVHVVAPDGTVRELTADLVVACLGRHGPVQDWLTALGCPAPAEDGVRIDMMYASRYLRLPPDSLGGDKEIVIAGREPARGLALFEVEGGRHILTLIGYGGDHPPTDEDGYWRFAASVAPPDVREALAAAEPLTEVATYRYPANRRRRYERLRRFPRGLLVLGDAVCSFSPAFGQGMTVSAAQALCLRDTLAAGDHELSRRFFRAVADAVDDPWMITALFDRAMPHVGSGGRLGTRALSVATEFAMMVGARDARVGGQIARIAGLLDPPTAALRPGLLAHAARGAGIAAVETLTALSPTGGVPALFGRAGSGPKAPGGSNRIRCAPEGFDPMPHGPARGFHRLVVRRVVPDTPDSVIVELDVPPPLRQRFAARPGQHVIVRGTHRDLPIRRSYSLCAVGDAGVVRIAVKRQRDGIFSTHAVDRLCSGAILHVGEPTGSFTVTPDPGRTRYAAVSAGSGITPLIPIIADVLDTVPTAEFTLHLGNRDIEHIMLKAPLAALAQRFAGRLRIVHHLSRAVRLPEADAHTAYRRGRLDPVAVVDSEADLWLLCGPRALLADTVAALRARAVPDSRILIEAFDTEPPVAAAESDAPPATVTLTGHGRDLVVRVPRGSSVLDAAVRVREDLPYSCLGGSCGTCVSTVESGSVECDPDPLSPLTADELARGRVLACRARPTSDEVRLRFG